MTKALQSNIQTAGTYAAGTTPYLSGLSSIRPSSGSTTESWRQIPYRTAGILSKLWLDVTANGVTTTSTFLTRVNGANGNQSISIGSGSTGFFEDASNTDSISVADKVNTQLVVGGSGTTITLRAFSCLFAANANTSVHIGCESSAGLTYTAGATRFEIICGGLTGTSASENQTVIPVAGTFRNLVVFINASGTTTASTVRTFKNGANGNLTVSIGNAATGIFEDTSNSDSIALNDLLSYQVISGASTPITVTVIGTEFITTNNTFPLLSNGHFSLSNSATELWFPIQGNNTTSYASEALAAVQARQSMILSLLSVKLLANTLNGGSSIIVYVSGIDTALALSIPSSTTGTFQHATNPVSVAANDLLSIHATESATTGSMTIQPLSILATPISFSPKNLILNQAVNRTNTY